MTVAELIEHLKTLPQDLPVGYINRCADEGVYFVGALRGEVTSYGSYGGKAFAPDNMPAICVVLE